MKRGQRPLAQPLPHSPTTKSRTNKEHEDGRGVLCCPLAQPGIVTEER
jgi:hypothetical protein